MLHGIRAQVKQIRRCFIIACALISALCSGGMLRAEEKMNPCTLIDEMKHEFNQKSFGDAFSKAGKFNDLLKIGQELIKSGQYETAIETILAAYTQYGSPFVRHMAVGDIGIAYEVDGKYQEANVCYEVIAKKTQNPNQKVFYKEKIKRLESKQKFGGQTFEPVAHDSKYYANSIQKLEGGDLYIDCWLGLEYLNRNDYSMGAHELDQCIGQENPDMQTVIGFAHIAAGELKSAGKNLLMAMYYEPERYVDILSLGRLLTSNGLVLEARTLYESALEDVNNKQILEALNEIEKERE